MKTLGITITAIMAIAASIVLRGYVISKLWLWFVVSAFNLPSLSIAQAAGISTLIGLLTHETPKYTKQGEHKNNNERIVFAFYWAFAFPPFVLLMGWVIKQFI